MAKNHAVMTLSEAAKFLRLPPKFIQEKVETGEIPGRHVGRAWRFSRAVLEKWLRGRYMQLTLLTDIDPSKNDKLSLSKSEKVYKKRRRSHNGK
jgi:excisionase family DNA binding protein